MCSECSVHKKPAEITQRILIERLDIAVFGKGNMRILSWDWGLCAQRVEHVEWITAKGNRHYTGNEFCRCYRREGARSHKQLEEPKGALVWIGCTISSTKYSLVYTEGYLPCPYRRHGVGPRRYKTDYLVAVIIRSWTGKQRPKKPPRFLTTMFYACNALIPN